MEQLIRYAEEYETEAFLTGDPSWFMHQVKGTDNQETMGFLASTLSYGSRVQFMPKIEMLLKSSDGEPLEWLRSGAYKREFAKGDKRSFYRLYSYDLYARFLDCYSGLTGEYGTLGNYVKSHAKTGLEAVEAICGFFATSSFGKTTVIPKDTTSACKRVCMFLRWMVRDNSPVDLGLWTFIDKKTLIMPLDTHVLQQSVALGLLSSKTASMSAAIRLSKRLGELFADDPLKGDFALFGYGVNNKNTNISTIR
ncbi:MAG: TIGR02757 family protein [Paludibacteraceae bacterium]|nr:TIGR02757 family protein [Paludibacteraceae bacterium]